MIVIPAVDLREGYCVQLVGGSYDNEAVRLDDPVKVALRWQHAGFKVLHIVDLDAATGRGSNRDVIRRIVESTDCATQIGGGIRTSEDVGDFICGGASRVVTGTRAVEDQAWIASVASSYPGRIVVAVDIRDRSVVTRGWAELHDRDFRETVSELGQLPLAGLLVTAVHREGKMEGTDLDLMRDVLRQTNLPIQASGGIGTMDDLRALKTLGVAAVVIGMALYTGALDPSTVIEEFGQ